MTRRRLLTGIAILIGAGATLWVLLVGVPRLGGRSEVTQAPQPAPAAPAAAQRKITATLFYITDDGMSLQGVQREVPFGERVDEQARHILEAQIAAAPDQLASAMPAGTTLRALYVSERGEAFVDLSKEVTTRHTGGALDELFTVYAVVNALTVNLPAITRVQILIDGKEADTLAGHVDLRHPLSQNLKWIKTDNPS
ncbi:MAG: GerMN domain-containing protein [Vicinamibacterales bacterium]